MTSRHSCLFALILTGLLGLNGCISSGDPGAATTPDPEATSPDNGQDPDDVSATDTGSAGEEVVDDIPTIEMMSEIDGIEIPRLEGSNQQLTIKGEVPVDLGNTAATDNSSEPVTGGSIIIRFNSEPKTLNPIVETSAVQQYISEYTSLALARMDPETLEYAPSLAERWVAEDSVKLSPSYSGYERQISEGGATPTSELELDYDPGSGEEMATVTLTSHDGDGAVLGNVWVGLYPIGE
ncbi:MAG: hypothetical protein QGH11_05515, partial [Pirellulaceae bacterium]|nr:hypothetical protein [Pirellulaceae bacterium]